MLSKEGWMIMKIKKGEMLGGGLHEKNNGRGSKKKVREVNFFVLHVSRWFLLGQIFYLGAGQNGRNLFSCLRTFF